MKKSLVFAMAMALGVTASAYAANPFSDVPAGHWAYDSVAELAEAGIIEGYGDNTFGGDKLMTRYEMAQIVAKAMANGADVDALAAEFADELDSLGVRVASLEKKADNVKIRGEVRARYIDQSEGEKIVPMSDYYYERLGNQTSHVADLRTRLWVEGSINDNWTYTGMLENTQDLTDNGGNDDIDLKRAYLAGRLGGTDVIAGRYNLLVADGNIYDGTVDGASVSYGDKIKVTAFAGKASDGFTALPFYVYQQGELFEGGDINNAGDFIGLAVDTKLGNKLTLSAGYADFSKLGEDETYHEEFDSPGMNVDNSGVSNGIFNISTTYAPDENVKLSATYLQGDLNFKVKEVRLDGEDLGFNDMDEADAYFKERINELLDDDGFVLGVDYKGADKADKGSWGAWAKYYDQGAQTYLAHTTDANTFGMLSGFEGYGIVNA